jgi:hypothetical protein
MMQQMGMMWEELVKDRMKILTDKGKDMSPSKEILQTEY